MVVRALSGALALQFRDHLLQFGFELQKGAQHFADEMVVAKNALHVQSKALTLARVVADEVPPGAAGQHIVRELRWQERLGEATYLYLDGELTVKAPGQAHADAGQRLAVTLPATALHLFDEQGLALPRCIPAPDLRLPEAA